MSAIQLDNLSLSYGDKLVLSKVSFCIDHGQWVVILGRSGCGKSTLLKAMANLDHGASQQGRIQCKVHIAYMAQQDALLPWLSVVQNVQLSHYLHHTRTPKTLLRAHELLEKVGLQAYVNKPPYLLSGGQRQRVALARTLMQSADLILMDEPFSAVDAITRLELQQLATELLSDKTVVLITHDPLEAIRLANKVYVMRDARLSDAFMPVGSSPRFLPEQTQPELQQQLLNELRR